MVAPGRTCYLWRTRSLRKYANPKYHIGDITTRHK